MLSTKILRVSDAQGQQAVGGATEEWRCGHHGHPTQITHLGDTAKPNTATGNFRFSLTSLRFHQQPDFVLVIINTLSGDNRQWYISP
jgi:hypothetical protein